MEKLVVNLGDHFWVREGWESLREVMCRDSETRDQRELIREFRESSEKITEGLAESEKFRGVQRCLVCHVSSIKEAQKQRQDNAALSLNNLIKSAFTTIPKLTGQIN